MNVVILFLILVNGDGSYDMREQPTHYATDTECREAGREYIREYPQLVRGYICQAAEEVSAEHLPE